MQLTSKLDRPFYNTKSMSVQKLVLIEGDAVAKFQFQNSSTNIYYYPRIIRASPYNMKEHVKTNLKKVWMN